MDKISTTKLNGAFNIVSPEQGGPEFIGAWQVKGDYFSPFIYVVHKVHAIYECTAFEQTAHKRDLYEFKIKKIDPPVDSDIMLPKLGLI